MRFVAKIMAIEPAKKVEIEKVNGSPNSTEANLTELVDRIEATTHAAAAAPRGVSSAAWRGFIEKHPEIEDPFARVVQAAPDIADATGRTFLDNLIKQMDEYGISDEAEKIAKGLESYYRHEDSNGNLCEYNPKTGEFKSKTGLPCNLVKVAGGGMSAVKELIQKATNEARSEVKEKIEKSVQKALEEVVKGPRKMWSKLSDAWKATLLLAGLAAAAPRVTGLKLSGDNIEFQIPPGIGNFSGGLKISNGNLKSLSITLPPVRIKGLLIRAGGGFEEGAGEGQISVVVPVKKASVNVSVKHEQSSTDQKTTLDAGVSRPIGESGGRIQAGTQTAFQPGQKIPTNYSVQIATPVGPTKNVSLSAGVVGTVTTSGQRVELAGNPAVTVGVSGELPSLNKRIRYNQKEEERREEEKSNLRTRESVLVASLQNMDPEKQKEEMMKAEEELREVRKEIGSTNKQKRKDKSINGDEIFGVGAMLAVLAYGMSATHKPKNGSRVKRNRG